LIGSCKFGEKTARKIEKFLGRPEGWLDTIKETESNESIGYFYKVFESLSPEQKKQVSDYAKYIASQYQENNQENNQETPQKKQNNPLTTHTQNVGGGAS
jgi:hypothetical protein